VSAFQEHISTLIKLHVDRTSTDDPGDVLNLLLSAFVQHLATLHYLLVSPQFFLIFYK